MKTEPNAPADTRMMGIVHEALRRDLTRAKRALSQTPPPHDPQREALAAHLQWMMRFLHTHHAGEDAGLYRMVRERNPAAGALLDAMDADHKAIGPGMDALERAAAEYGQSDSAEHRERVLASIDRLEETLLPHLRREEDEMMPVVSSTITVAEWHALEQQQNIKPKSFIDLGREGHWILDGLDHDDREVVVGLVPAVPRFILVHGFAASYRRHQARCWGNTSPRGRRVQKDGRVEVTVDADPDQVRAVIGDVTRVGEWSHECHGAEWLGGATQATPGAQFRGLNRSGLIRWGRKCEIVVAEPRELVWRTVPTRLYPDSVEWTIRLHEVNGLTSIEQTYHILTIPKILDMAYATILPGHRDRTDALIEDLRRLGALASRTDDGAPAQVRPTLTTTSANTTTANPHTQSHSR
jgi:hemerythrin-like domain-containing protein